YDEAVQYLETAIKLNANSSLTHLNMGIILNEKKKFAEAKEQLSKAIELDFRNPLAHFELGVASFKLNDFIQAQMEFETTVGMAANKIPLSRLYLAEIYKRSSRKTEAINQLESFLKENTKENPYTEIVKKELEKLKQDK
ncbi:MAG: anapc3, partial [bacterium]